MNRYEQLATDHITGKHDPVATLPFYGCHLCAEEVGSGERPDPDNTTGRRPEEKEEDAMSWAPEVLVDGKWSGNGLRFATQEEAERWGMDLLMRWFVPTDSRAVESPDPVNYRLLDDGRIEEGAGVIEQIECPECGSTWWARTASGTYAAREWIETASSLAMVEERDLMTNRMDATDWTCSNDHVADDETNDRLAEVEGA